MTVRYIYKWVWVEDTRRVSVTKTACQWRGHFKLEGTGDFPDVIEVCGAVAGDCISRMWGQVC